MDDRASLSNLNDIVLPADVAWWPLAPGWYVLAGAGLLLLAYVIYRYWRLRKKNRYRVLALREFAAIRGDDNPATLQQLPTLLKRTALTVWPRHKVAALNGTDWHHFLDQTAVTRLFVSGAGDILDRLAYAGDEAKPMGSQDVQTLMEAALYWLKNHRNEPVDG